MFFFYYQIKQSDALTSETEKVVNEPGLHSISSENNSNQIIIHVRTS